jgi:hypothetical protein
MDSPSSSVMMDKKKAFQTRVIIKDHTKTPIQKGLKDEKE